ncbi:MAG: hypothetical protein LBD89_01900 [Tannerellaceae bacterium]|jgi:hypothetical protein|nr:hypothetical protein [Tannerellaceae bacterium]
MSAPLYTAEPGKVPFLLGKVWELEGILDLTAQTLTTLTVATPAGSYSLCFDSDSTANGKILDTEMKLSLSRPFFQLSGAKEENEEAQRFVRIASGIIGCEYHSFEDSLMRFYNEDYRTCLVFRFKSVRDKTGVMTYTTPPYASQPGRWTIRDDSDGGFRVVLYDGGDEYIPEDLPDEFKKEGLRVKFSGEVTRPPRMALVTYYFINLSSVNKLPN